MVKTNNKGVYIQSIEANKIYCNNKRGDYLTNDYVGMIPYSLQLIKLESCKGFKKFPSKFNPNKYLSNDLVNVSFNYDVDAYDKVVTRKNEQIKMYEANIKELEAVGDKKSLKQVEVFNKKLKELNDYLDKIKLSKENDEWKSMKAEKLREVLYQEGFYIEYPRGNKTERIEYVQFSRSTSKSRKGEILFIKKSLHKQMTEWQRMNLKFNEDEIIDLVSIRAYESLVGSALDGLININVDNILLVEDVESTFTEKVNLVHTVTKGKKKKLNVKVIDNHSLTNDIFDGESLLDVSVFEQSVYSDKSFVLLRNHWFKSAGFKTDIQQFLIDNCPNDAKFEDWVLYDMFGNPIKAEDVKMIVTPNSMKMFKMAYKMGVNDAIENKKAMYEYWKQIVVNEGQLFGVCKYEKPSQAPLLTGTLTVGTVTQRMSYQHINALLANKNDMDKLLKIEMDYLDELKNDPATLIEHLKATSNDSNLNDFYVQLYEINPNIYYTKMFKDYRSQVVYRYKKRLAKGKVRVEGDNLIMLSNPIELLKHAIGQLDLNDLALKENQVYTTQFDFEQYIALHRNPHTNPSNSLLARNTYNAEIKRYIKVSKNIIVVNSVGHSIMSRLSGCDYDSDFVHATNNKTVVALVAEANEKYWVCETSVKESKDEATVYNLTDTDMARADNKIAESKTVIGECVNAGQLAMSLYHHLKSIGKDDEADEVLQLTNLVASLSTLAIDVAKKTFEIDVKKAVRSVVLKVNKYINKDMNLLGFKGSDDAKKFKPSFFEMIDRKERDGVVYVKYNTPMDMLQEILKKDRKANTTDTVELIDLLDNSLNKDKANRNQKKKLIELAEELESKVDAVYAEVKEKEKQIILIDDITREFENRIAKLKIKTETIYSLIVDIHDSKARVKIDKKYNKMMKLLALTHRTCFVNVFSQNFNGNTNKTSRKAS